MVFLPHWCQLFPIAAISAFCLAGRGIFCRYKKKKEVDKSNRIYSISSWNFWVVTQLPIILKQIPWQESSIAIWSQLWEQSLAGLNANCSHFALTHSVTTLYRTLQVPLKTSQAGTACLPTENPDWLDFGGSVMAFRHFDVTLSNIN